MSKIEEREYWVPEHVREYLRGLGFVLPLEAMESHIRNWHAWMSATGDFYDYRDTDGFGRVYEVHRRSIHPAMRVCNEWGSLLLNDKTQVICDDQACTDWLAAFFTETGFMPQAQNAIVRAFGMGTGAWALWVDADARQVRIRQYDARMVLPLTWDEEGVTECAFVTRVFYRGKAVDQLQMYLRGGSAVGGLDDWQASSSPSPSESSLSHGNGARFQNQLCLEAWMETGRILPDLHLPYFRNLNLRAWEGRTGSSPRASTRRETSSSPRACARTTTREALSPPSPSSSRRWTTRAWTCSSGDCPQVFITVSTPGRSSRASPSY